MNILLLATAWGPRFGGINAFNRDFAQGLSKCLDINDNVFCAVIGPSIKDIQDAAQNGVILVPVCSQTPHHNFEALLLDEVWSWLNNKVESLAVDVWVGHDVISGEAALDAASRFGGIAALIHHMSYVSYQNYKQESSQEAEEKHFQQKILFSSNATLFSVGPLLQKSCQELSGKESFQLIPGFPEEIVDSKSSNNRLVAIAYGRMEKASDRIKQGRLAVASFGEAIYRVRSQELSLEAFNDPRMYIVGLESESDHEEKAIKLIADKYAKRATNVFALPFDQDRKRLFERMSEANLSLMLSWHEGFGLTGWEAIAAEVPLILTERSGLYQLIEESLAGTGTGCVECVDIRGCRSDDEENFTKNDLETVSLKIMKIGADLTKYKKNAVQLKTALIEKLECTWLHTAEQFIVDLSTDNPSSSNLTTTAEKIISRKIRETQRQETEESSYDPSVMLVPFATQQKFVDRDYFQCLLDFIKSGSGLVILTGPSGCGKSRTAKELFNLAKNQSMPFDIQIWITLTEGPFSDIETIVNKSVTELGAREVLTAPFPRKVEVLHNLLEKKRVLLIIDNFENEFPESISETLDFIRRLPSTCQVVVTTTIADTDLFDKTKQINVSEFDIFETEEFLKELLSLRGPLPFDSTDSLFLEKIQIYTGGSPRAIELVVSALRHTSPEQLFSELDDLLGLNPGPTAGRPSRFRSTLEKLHVPGWKRLDQNARKLLRVAKVFRGPADSRALQEAASLSYGEFNSAMSRLIDNSFAQPVADESGYRYMLHHSTHLFLLNSEGEEEFDITSVFQRLARYFTNKLRLHPEGANLFEPDMETILAVSVWCERNGAHSSLTDLCMGAYDILFSLGLFQERISQAKLAKVSAVKIENLSLAAHFVTVSASTETMLGNYSSAEMELKQGMEYALDSGDELRVIYMKRCQALNLYRSKDIDGALTTIKGLERQALSQLAKERTPDRIKEAQHAYIDVVALQAAISLFIGHIAEAKKYFDLMLNACKEAGWYRATSYPIRDLAEINFCTGGSKSKTRASLKEAMEIASSTSDYRQTARIEMSLAKLSLLSGRFRMARRYRDNARNVFFNMGLENELAELDAMYGELSIVGRMKRFYKLFQRPKIYYGNSPIGGE